MDTTARDAFAAHLADANHLVEVAIGERSDLAATLAAVGVDVVATDIRGRAVPDGVSFVRDDLTDPDLTIYRGADGMYGRNLPAELQRPALEVARTVDVPLWFTTLGAEEPVISVERETLHGETLYIAIMDS